MRVKNIINTWFLRLFSLLLILLFCIFLIFLIKPQYFIEDIEGYVYRKLSSSMDGILNIGKIEGNFINGFSIGPIEYIEDTTIIFATNKIYIDPDISQIIFGTIALSEVKINNAYYNFDKVNVEFNKLKNYRRRSILNFDISSLIINEILVLYKNNQYDIEAELMLKYSDGIYLDINNVNLQSSLWPDTLNISSGSIYYLNNELTLSNVTSSAEWMSATINKSRINLDDLSKSTGKIKVNKLHYSLYDSIPIIIV